MSQTIALNSIALLMNADGPATYQRATQTLETTEGNVAIAEQDVYPLAPGWCLVFQWGRWLLVQDQ